MNNGSRLPQPLEQNEAAYAPLLGFREVIENGIVVSVDWSFAAPRKNFEAWSKYQNNPELWINPRIKASMVKHCLNCGCTNVAVVKVDRLGKHAECPRCGSTSDCN